MKIMGTIIILILVVGYIVWASLLNIGLIQKEQKLNDRITLLEDTNRNNCSKKNYYKNIVENAGYTRVTMGQKNLIKQEITRLKSKYNLNEIAVELKISQSMMSRLNNIEGLDIKKNNADKYIKKLKTIT